MQPTGVLKVAPLVWVRWVTEITVAEERRAFVDEQRSGPYRFWHHRHSFEEVDGTTVRIRIGEEQTEVPRYWLARFLFRVALHGYAIGYLETYGGFWYDDRDGIHRLGVRGKGSVALGERELEPTFEQLYRAVAPSGYIERID